MLKNIRSDSDNKLNSFQLTTIIHSIENQELPSAIGTEIILANNISKQLNHLINNPTYRRSIQSPNGTENPLTDDCVKEMEKMKEELDTLVSDGYLEMKSSNLQRTINSY